MISRECLQKKISLVWLKHTLCPATHISTAAKPVSTEMCHYVLCCRIPLVTTLSDPFQTDWRHCLCRVTWKVSFYLTSQCALLKCQTAITEILGVCFIVIVRRAWNWILHEICQERDWHFSTCRSFPFWWISLPKQITPVVENSLDDSPKTPNAMTRFFHQISEIPNKWWAPHPFHAFDVLQQYLWHFLTSTFFARFNSS